MLACFRTFPLSCATADGRHCTAPGPCPTAQEEVRIPKPEREPKASAGSEGEPRPHRPLSAAERTSIRRLARRRERERTGLTLVEGVRCVSEALGAGATVRLAVVAPGLARLPGGRDLEAALRETAPTADVPDRELRALADTQSPQGVLLVCDRTTASLSTLDPGGRFLALDGVQDPGNVGTLVRSAHAFGLSGVIVLEGCADPWGPKALRASAGSVFHIPVAYATVEGLLEWARQGGVGLKVAEAASAGLAPPSAGAGAGWTLVIGNEGAGVSEGIQEAAGATVSIPMVGGTESLNAAVAGSIILYLLTREATGSGEAT